MKIGYCLTGSFCTFAKSLEALEALVRAGHTITPIMSQAAYTTDTRFGDAVDIQNRLIAITGNSIIHTIAQAEPVGPKKMFDVLAIVPCTGNTLAKLAAGITDTAGSKGAKRPPRQLSIMTPRWSLACPPMTLWAVLPRISASCSITSTFILCPLAWITAI